MRDSRFNSKLQCGDSRGKGHLKIEEKKGGQNLLKARFQEPIGRKIKGVSLLKVTSLEPNEGLWGGQGGGVSSVQGKKKKGLGRKTKLIRRKN